MVSIKSSYLITYQFLSIPVNIMRKYVTIWTAGVRIRIIIELMENFLTDKIIFLSRQQINSLFYLKLYLKKKKK